MPDELTPTILRHIESLGYQVTADIGIGGVVIIATKDGQTHRAESDETSDAYRCACELAEAVGIELTDG